MTNWTDSYLRIPYVAGGSDHSGCDCWGLFRLVQLERFGHLIRPIPDMGVVDAERVRAQTIADERRSSWAEVMEPMEGDAVLMSQALQPSHVGIWVSALGGAILHTTQGSGVRLQRIVELKANFFYIRRFYRYVG